MTVDTLSSAVMSPRKRYAFWIDPDLETGLKALKARDGMPEAEGVRRAIAEFLKRKGIATAAKADRRRARTRRQS
jgi:hypothetical protein